jgi:zinc transport system permease protein
VNALPGMPWALPWPFDRSYMQLALVAGVVVGATAPLIGAFVVQKGMSLVGDGLGHVAVAGIGAALLFDTSPTWTAMAFAVAAALVIEWLRARGGTTGDLALALVFYGGIAAGVVLASRSGTNTNLQPYLFGSILTATANDVWTVIALGVAIVTAVALTGRALFAVVLDEDAARVSGIPAGVLNVLLAVLTAVTVVAAMRIVGVLLIAALMVLPVGASRLVARSFRGTVFGAVAIGVSSAVLGLIAARAWALAAGGAIVLVAALWFVVASIGAAVRRAGTPARTGAAQHGSLVTGPH